MKPLAYLLALLLVACTLPESENTGPLTAQSCPQDGPRQGDSCCQLPDGYQCGPCVCSRDKWSCHGGTDGGGPVTCPASGPKPGDSCSQFPKDYQCARCVCSANRVWACF